MVIDNANILDTNNLLLKNRRISKAFKNIRLLERIELSNGGSNDVEGYQIFTPRFIVEDMTNAIGTDNITDFTKNVLEPTSGDGAFVVYILEQRLKTINGDNVLANVLRAISTIYSIEMDEELILKQRNNVYTLVKMFLNERNIDITDEYDTFLRLMISTNCMWAMFNTEPLGFLTDLLASYMPLDKDGKNVEFPVWEITDDLMISLRFEVADV